MKTIHYSFLVVAFMFLVACGGGGGAPSTDAGGGGAPPTDTGGNTIRTTNYPNWAVTNPSRARTIAQGEILNFTSAQVGSLLNRQRSAANRYLSSDVLGTGGLRFPTICSGPTCTTDYRRVGGSATPENIGDPSPAINVTVYQPLMTKNSISIGQGRGRLENAPSTGLHRNFLGIVGLLDYSVFSIGGLGLYRGSQLSTTYVSAFSFGNSPGTNPTSSTGSATWSGVMLGVDYSTTGLPLSILEGNANITVRGFASTPTVDVSFSGVRNLNTGASHTLGGWSNIPLSNGVFRTGSGTNQIEGTFYGTEHQEVGGHFEQSTIIGAFGGKRRP